MEPVRMATSIASYEAIEKLTHINGLSIERIELRARPRGMATSGFIGADESFKEVLQRDWKTVEALGTTHIELAERIREIWREAENKQAFLSFETIDNTAPLKLPEPKRPPSYTRMRIFALEVIMGIGALIAAYRYSPCALAALVPAAGCITYASRVKKVDPVKEKTLSVIGHIRMCFGKQDDIFDQRLGWGRDLLLKDTKNDLLIMIGEGVVDYIEQYGFYEGGGESNPYRVDPLKLVAILTGSTIAELQARLGK